MGKREIYHDFGSRVNLRLADLLLTEEFFFNNQWILVLWLLILFNRDRCDSNCFGITYGGHYSYYDPCIRNEKYSCNNGLYFVPQCGGQPCNPNYRNNSFIGGSYNNIWWIFLLIFFNNRNNNSNCLPNRQKEDGGK